MKTDTFLIYVWCPKRIGFFQIFVFSFFSASATISDDETEKNVEGPNFERHKFPRDSGCFASSSPASDRSSQQSHSESGIHDFEMEETPVKTQAHGAQARRALRDRHTLNTHELETLTLNSPKKDSFEVLVEKYVTEKTPLQVEHGRVRDARSIFEGCN